MSAPARVVTQVALLASERLRSELGEHLGRGGLVAYPTATVYGFGGRAIPEAVAALDALKRRPPEKPYLVLVRSRDQVATLDWNESARILAERFWPGPLTLVLSDPRERFPPSLRGPEGGVAVRHTGHLGARAVLAAAGDSLTSSSANPPGERPAQSGLEAAEVTSRLNGTDVWSVDGGRLPTSPSSTIVDLCGREPRIIREGAIPTAAIEAALSGAGIETTWSRPTRLLFVCTGNTCRSPIAEAIARERLRQLGWKSVEVASAGVWATAGQPASPEAVQVAELRGVGLAAHRSSALSPEQLLTTDLVLTMGPDHLEALLETDAAGRASTLGAFADGRVDPFDGLPVPDPIGMGLDTYEATFRRLETAIGLAFARLAPMLGDP